MSDASDDDFEVPARYRVIEGPHQRLDGPQGVFGPVEVHGDGTEGVSTSAYDARAGNLFGLKATPR